MAKRQDMFDLDPDRRPLTPIQAERLAALSDLEPKELIGKPVRELGESFRWRIDPELLFFRKVCGRVVKRDPVTGVEYPVPLATVHVEDTDCSLLGFFPVASPWAWFFPFHCKREVIATVKTDACGRFCVYIPRFEIDWILRFRRERLCFPDIFIRPTIKDLLDDLVEIPFPRRPIPEPDPPPLLFDGGITFQRVQQALGTAVAGKLAEFEAGAVFGQNVSERRRLLERRAFTEGLTPPLPAELRGIERAPLPAKDAPSRGRDAAGGATPDIVHATLAARLRIDPAVLARLDLDRFVGPFRRCVDVIVPEWVPVFDVPDVTFRVTQDVDGDGTEETIYSEGFFDVRWNAGPIPDVTLEASPIAVTGHVCDVPHVPCGDTPAILFAGLHPLVHDDPPADPYFNAVSGYAVRPNRPHPSGALIDPLPNPAATAPLARTLQLYGCHRIQNAAHYRVRYSFNGGASVPFVGLTWPLYRIVGGSLQSHWPISDAAGWYPVLPAADGWFPDLLLVEWNSAAVPDGRYELQLDIGDAAKNVIGTSAPVALRIDNSAPSAQFTKLRWRRAGDVAWIDLPLTCAVIGRGVAPSDIQIEVSYSVAASHLRSVVLRGGGCGGGNPSLSSALGSAQHWHTGPFDNSVTNTAVFDLAAVHPAGGYSFSLYASSRAFNPSGGDGGHLADWNYDPGPIYVIPSLPVAVVNA